MSNENEYIEHPEEQEEKPKRKKKAEWSAMTAVWVVTSTHKESMRSQKNYTAIAKETADASTRLVQGGSSEEE